MCILTVSIKIEKAKMACAKTLKLFTGEFGNGNWSKGRCVKKQKMGESEDQLNNREIREVEKYWMQRKRRVYSKCKKIPPNEKAPQQNYANVRRFKDEEQKLLKLRQNQNTIKNIL